MAESDSDDSGEKPVSGVTGWLWKNREAVGQLLKDLAGWLFRRKKDADSESGEPEPGIAIMGPGGVGKTTLAKILSGQYDFLLDAPGSYEETIGLERFNLADDPDVELLVPPGQSFRRDATWTDIEHVIGAGEFRGLILVSAYGYHSLGFRLNEHKLWKGSKSQFLKDYLEACRAEELAVLARLSPHIRRNRQKFWLLSLVMKQDLWDDDNKGVVAHYRDGPYGQAIASLVAGNPDHLRHEWWYGSLVISNFRTTFDEELQLTRAGYDHPRQIDTLRRLFEILGALKDWESSR